MITSLVHQINWRSQQQQQQHWLPLRCLALHKHKPHSNNSLLKQLYTDQSSTINNNKCKRPVFAIALLTWVRLVSRSTLQSRKWQLISIIQQHIMQPFTVNSWMCNASCRNTTTRLSHIRPSTTEWQHNKLLLISHRLRVGGWVGLSTRLCEWPEWDSNCNI